MNGGCPAISSLATANTATSIMTGPVSTTSSSVPRAAPTMTVAMSSQKQARPRRDEICSGYVHMTITTVSAATPSNAAVTGPPSISAGGTGPWAVTINWTRYPMPTARAAKPYARQKRRAGSPAGSRRTIRRAVSIAVVSKITEADQLSRPSLSGVPAPWSSTPTASTTTPACASSTGSAGSR